MKLKLYKSIMILFIFVLCEDACSISAVFQGGGSDVVSFVCFGARVSVMFHFIVHYTFSSVWVAE